MIKYPEHEKLKALDGKNQIIGDFIYFLDEVGLCICDKDEDRERYFPTHKTIEQIVGDYFDIDQNKIEKEKRMMLEGIRENHV